MTRTTIRCRVTFLGTIYKGGYCGSCNSNLLLTVIALEY